MDIEMGKITVDVEIVGRVDGLDFVTIQSYADDMEAGAVFPPVELVGDGDVFWLVDGQHRLEAAKRVNGDQISAKVTKGDRWAALEMSGDNNADNGRPRTNEDKRQKVLMFLEGERWKDWSNNKIAEKCKVSHTFVNKLRNHTCNVSSMKTERTFIHHKTGQPTTMDITNIGSSNGDLVQSVMIEEITVDPKIVDRANDRLNSEIVQTYADYMEDGAEFPPIDIVDDGDTLWLVDGQLRLEAVKELGQPTISAKITRGNRRDALLMSCGTNATEKHGKQLTNGDREYKVLQMLEDEEWSKLSDREAANVCHVPKKLVRKIRDLTPDMRSERIEYYKRQRAKHQERNVLIMLEDEHWCKLHSHNRSEWSDREIASTFNVSEKLVGEIKGLTEVEKRVIRG